MAAYSTPTLSTNARTPSVTKPTVRLRSNPFVVGCGSQQFGSSPVPVRPVPVRPVPVRAVRARLLVQQEDIASCSTRRQISCLTKYMSSCLAGRHVFLSNKMTCLRVRREDVSSYQTRRHVFCRPRRHFSCRTRTHVFLSNNKTCPLVEQEGASSSSTRRHVPHEINVLSFDKKTLSSCLTRHAFSANEKTCLLFDQENMQSCRTRCVFLFNKKRCLLVQLGDMSGQFAHCLCAAAVPDSSGSRGSGLCFVYWLWVGRAVQFASSSVRKALVHSHPPCSV